MIMPKTKPRIIEQVQMMKAFREAVTSGDKNWSRDFLAALKRGAATLAPDLVLFLEHYHWNSGNRILQGRSEPEGKNEKEDNCHWHAKRRGGGSGSRRLHLTSYRASGSCLLLHSSGSDLPWSTLLSPDAMLRSTV